MKLTLAVLALAAAPLAQSPPAPSSPAAAPAASAPKAPPAASVDLLARVQRTYAEGGNLCAAFEQTYVEKLRGKKRVESGRLWAKRDGRVRWSYERPLKKDFVYDGKKAYFYEPEHAQVTEFADFEGSPLWNALRFLWGQGSLSETFALEACDATCFEPSAGATALRLVPKQPIAAVDHVVLEVEPDKARVRRSVVYDSLGNRSEYAFGDVALGCKVDDEKVTFPKLKGVSYIRATGDGAK